jgi:hypothetical protein
LRRGTVGASPVPAQRLALQQFEAANGAARFSPWRLRKKSQEVPMENA